MTREAPDVDEIAPVDRLDRLAATIGHGEIPPLAAKFLALQLVGAWPVERDLGPDLDGHIHLVVGLPATANESLIAGRMADLLNHSDQVSGTSASRAGTIASYRGSEVTSGAALDSDTDLLIIEQANELSEDMTRPLAEIMNSGRLQITQENISTEISQSASYLLLHELKYGGFDELAPIGEQFDIKPHLGAATDATVAGWGAGWKYESSPFEGEMAKALVQGARTNSPGWTNASRRLVEEEAVEILSRIDPEGRLSQARESRLQEAIWKFAEAATRLLDRNQVQEEDVHFAADIYRDNLKRLGTLMPSDDEGAFDADVIKTGDEDEQRENVKELISDIEKQYEEGAPVDVIVDRAREAGIGESKAQHLIDKLKTRGELYEPKKDHLRTT